MLRHVCATRAAASVVSSPLPRRSSCPARAVSATAAASSPRARGVSSSSQASSCSYAGTAMVWEPRACGRRHRHQRRLHRSAPPAIEVALGTHRRLRPVVQLACFEGDVRSARETALRCFLGREAGLRSRRETGHLTGTMAGASAERTFARDPTPRGGSCTPRARRAARRRTM